MTSSTEIYTDLPTLALQDALPTNGMRPDRRRDVSKIGFQTETAAFGTAIQPSRRPRRSARRSRGRTGSAIAPAPRNPARLPIPKVPGKRARRPVRCRAAPVRSEEHTSELQSLIRIAYDVFHRDLH